MFNLLIFSKLFCTDENFIIRIEYDQKHKKVLEELRLKFNTYAKNIKDVITNITTIKNINEVDDIIKDIDDIRKKKYNEESKLQIVKLIKNLLQKIDYLVFSGDKIVFAILIFDVLNTDVGTNLLEQHPKFKTTVEFKIKEFKNLDYINRNFTVYMNENYETGKKYISVLKNKKYYKNLLKNTLFGLYVFYSLYKKVKNKKNNCLIS